MTFSHHYKPCTFSAGWLIIPHIAINTENLTQKETCDLILEILNLWKLDGEKRNYILNNYSIYNLSENEKLS